MPASLGLLHCGAPAPRIWLQHTVPCPGRKQGSPYRQTRLKEGHVLREKSCILGTLPEGNVSSLR